MSGGVRVLALATPWQHEWRLFWRQLGAEYDREATLETRAIWLRQDADALSTAFYEALTPAFMEMQAALRDFGVACAAMFRD